jgi:hypothetical protein
VMTQEATRAESRPEGRPSRLTDALGFSAALHHPVHAAHAAHAAHATGHAGSGLLGHAQGWWRVKDPADLEKLGLRLDDNWTGRRRRLVTPIASSGS